MPSKYKINRIGIYFSRHVYFFTIDVREVIKKDVFPKFVNWFKKRALEEYITRVSI